MGSWRGLQGRVRRSGREVGLQLRAGWLSRDRLSLPGHLRCDGPGLATRPTQRASFSQAESAGDR